MRLRTSAALGLLLAFLLTTAAATVGTLGGARRRPVSQPIAFNHKKHVEENGLDCATCHPFYETETFSGLPDEEVCSTCHLEPLGDSEEERRLTQILQAGGPLEWRSLFRQPAHVFYSHRTHVVDAGLECGACHGAIGASEAPPRRPDPLRMEECVACHRRAGASTACTACHR